MTIDIDKLRAELRAGLKGTTQGEWLWDCGIVPPDGPESYADIYTKDETILARFNNQIPQGKANARHIALASPENVAALLDHIDDLTLSARHSADVATQAIARAEAAEKERDEAKANYEAERRTAIKLYMDAERATTAEAELARLRKPGTEGEVGEVVKRLTDYAARWNEPATSKAPVLDAADLLTRLAARVEEGERVMRRALPYVDDLATMERIDAYLQKDQTNAVE